MTRPRTSRPLFALIAVALAAVGCAQLGSDRSYDEPSAALTMADGTPGAAHDGNSDEPTGWGPTTGMLAQARDLVSGWSPEQLAGQVIVGRYHGADPQEAATMVRDLHLAGVCMTTANIVDAAQVKASTAAVHEAVAAGGRDFPAVIGVDQEGGPVSHLRGIAADYPPFLAAGAAVAGGHEGEQAVRESFEAMGLELRDLGYTWVFAPDADTTIGPKDPTIGTRAPSDNPEYAGKAAAAATRGFLAAGIIPTPKHYPGHGSVTTDSHQELPVQEMPLNELKATDLQPFSQVVEAGTPTVMLSHIAVQALAPDVPASLAPQVYTFLAQETGFNGVAVTDSLGMGAVTNAGGSPSVRGIQAGADLLLMPADTRLAHAELVGAINDGSVPRERIEEAAAKVVALQRWQQTTMDGIPVPGQAGQLARQGAKQLSAAAITQVSGQCEGPQVSDGIRIVGGSAADRAQLAGAARAAGLRVGTGTTIRLVQTGSGSGDVVVALDWPTVLAGSAGSRATYALYGQTEGAYAALVDVLTGAAPAPGGMAVEVPTVRTVDC